MVGLTPGFTYLVSMDDAGVGFDSPVMVYRGPVARFTMETLIGMAQLMGLRNLPFYMKCAFSPHHWCFLALGSFLPTWLVVADLLSEFPCT